MDKPFDKWNTLKKRIHARQNIPIFHEREIWWCALGVNVGYEQDGKNDLFERPILVLKKFNKDVLLILPLTRSKHQTVFKYDLGHNDSAVILSQVRLISSRRLLRKMRKMTGWQFREVIVRVKQIF
ncbi:MAG: type II toxin-antitoxin system PemK/MazF family toxin [Patescibacteria group bacterium]